MVDLPLQDSDAAQILLHRDAHFSGSFPLMLSYYRKNGIGASPDITLTQIEKMAAFEEEIGQNVAPLVLTGIDAERIAEVKDAYQKLRDLYEMDSEENKYALLIADLILSEEEEPVQEIEAICSEGTKMLFPLIDLLKAEDFYDPLFPGYGRAPLLAAKCLGRVGNKKAIIALFEALDEGDFVHEETLLQALKTLGEPAKEFLLTVLKGMPITYDNERAAIALIAFKEDQEVAKTALALLNESAVKKTFPLSGYLALICQGLQESHNRKAFADLAEASDTPKMLKKDIEAVLREWNL